jgi:hypothetical protein
MSAAVLTVNCATCSGGTTVNFEVTEDGTNYSAINAVQLGTTTIASSTTTAGVTLWEMPVGGTVSVRARVSAYSAGTVTVTGHTVPVPYNAKVVALPSTQSLNAVQSGTWNIGTVTTLPAITFASPQAVTESGTWTVQPGNTPNTSPWLMTDTPSSAAGAGIAAVVSGAAEGTHVLKASAGNLYGLTTTIGVTTGWVMVFNATSAPADGAVTPVFCRYIKSDGTGGSNSVEFKPPLAFSTGVSVAFSSTGCFTKTASATAFFAGQVQ